MSSPDPEPSLLQRTAFAVLYFAGVAFLAIAIGGKVLYDRLMDVL